MAARGNFAYRDASNWTEDETGCWLWQRARSKRTGHAQAWNGKYMDHAHRLVYADRVAEIPKGFDLHHRCENPQCVNPGHMEIVEAREHIRRHKTTIPVDKHPEILVRLLNGDRQVDIAADYGVSQVRISQIKRGI